MHKYKMRWMQTSLRKMEKHIEQSRIQSLLAEIRTHKRKAVSQRHYLNFFTRSSAHGQKMRFWAFWVPDKERNNQWQEGTCFFKEEDNSCHRDDSFCVQKPRGRTSIDGLYYPYVYSSPFSLGAPPGLFKHVRASSGTHSSWNSVEGPKSHLYSRY